MGLREHCAPLTQFTEHGCERHLKDLVAIVIGDVQNPAAPVFHTGRRDERSHDPVGVFVGLGEVVETAMPRRSISTSRELE